MIETTIRGYRHSSPAERASLGMLTSCAVSIACARTVNYIRERRRTAPLLRSLARRALTLPPQKRVRVHHYVPGIGLAFVSGVCAIVTRDDGREVWLSLPFGTGVGLTLDEVTVMTERDSPYWRSERLAIVQAASAGLSALGIVVHLHYRGKRLAGRD